MTVVMWRKSRGERSEKNKAAISSYACVCDSVDVYLSSAPNAASVHALMAHPLSSSAKASSAQPTRSGKKNVAVMDSAGMPE